MNVLGRAPRPLGGEHGLATAAFMASFGAAVLSPPSPPPSSLPCPCCWPWAWPRPLPLACLVPLAQLAQLLSHTPAPCTSLLLALALLLVLPARRLATTPAPKLQRRLGLCPLGTLGIFLVLPPSLLGCLPL